MTTPAPHGRRHTVGAFVLGWVSSAMTGAALWTAGCAYAYTRMGGDRLTPDAATALAVTIVALAIAVGSGVGAWLLDLLARRRTDRLAEEQRRRLDRAAEDLCRRVVTR